jgi:hypothetical protein
MEILFMKVFNGTAHQVNIYSIEQCDGSDPRKLIVGEGETPLYTIPAGTNLNCVKDNKATPKGDFPFPVKGAVEFTDVDPLPSGYDIYIVSNLYRSAYAELKGDTRKLATVDGVVYSDPANPRPCGCLGLAVG